MQFERPFAVLPLGTANDFARTIGLPPDPLQAAEVALNGCAHRIDVGLVNDRPYLNVARVDADSELAAETPATFLRMPRSADSDGTPGVAA